MRQIRASVLCIALMSALAACGGGSSQQSDELTLLVTNDPWTRAIKPLIGRFEKKSGVKVNVQAPGQEQELDKLQVTLRSKSPAVDVYASIPSAVGEQYFQSGYYQDLTKYINDDNRTPQSYKVNDFQQGAFKGEQLHGQQIGIPIAVEGPVVYYRKDLFRKYHIKTPHNLEQLMSAAQRIYKQSSGKYVVAMRGQARALVYLFGNFLHNMGASWADNSGQPTLTSPEAIKAIDTYATLARKYGPKGITNNTFTQSSALMAQGRASMEIESSNELGSVIGKGSRVSDKLGVFTLPPGPGGSHPTILVKGLSMSPFSDNKTAAWKFMRWATSPAVQLKLAQEGIASPRSSTNEDPAVKTSYQSGLKHEWHDALNLIQSRGNPNVGPPAVQQTQAREVIGQALDKVILGQSSPKDAAEEMQTGIKPLLS